MRSRFFTLASNLLFATAAFAQTPPAAPSPSPTPVGHIRFWNMLPKESGTFALRDSKKPSGEVLLSAYPYQYLPYSEFPVGRYNLALTKGSEATPVRTINLDLKPQSFFTVLISPPASAPKIEVFDDTVPPETAAGALIVRNYFNGLTVSATSGAQKLVHELGYGQSQSTTGLTLGIVPVKLQARLPNGNPAEAETEVDFRVSKRATLLIMPDPYGRFRPRISMDGVSSQ